MDQLENVGQFRPVIHHEADAVIYSQPEFLDGFVVTVKKNTADRHLSPQSSKQLATRNHVDAQAFIGDQFRYTAVQIGLGCIEYLIVGVVTI
jgi:hypothetical protein